VHGVLEEDENGPGYSYSETKLVCLGKDGDLMEPKPAKADRSLVTS
jgi:hypothetical protein